MPKADEHIARNSPEDSRTLTLMLTYSLSSGGVRSNFTSHSLLVFGAVLLEKIVGFSLRR